MLQMFVEIHKELYHALPFVLNTVGEYSDQPAVSRPKGFDAHHLIWVKDGEGRFCVGGETRVLRAGQGVFMREGVPHSYAGERMNTAWMTFVMCAEALDCMGVPSHLFFDVPAYLEKETEQLLAFSLGNSTALSRSCAGYAYVTDLFSAVTQSNESVETRVSRFLERRYADPLTLEDIAREAGMSRYALCRYYKQIRGMTVMEELKQIRLAKAKRLLRYSADPVEQIGRMCGFESGSYFCKQFKESVGVTPGEYRKRA